MPAWMIESTELPAVEVGVKLHLALELRPAQGWILVSPEDLIVRVVILDANSSYYMVEEPGSTTGPLLLRRERGKSAASPGTLLNGEWILMPSVDVSRSDWTPSEVAPWANQLRRDRLPMNIWETRSIGDDTEFVATLVSRRPEDVGAIVHKVRIATESS